MSKLLDGVIAASIVCDMIDSFRKLGVQIKIEDLDTEIARRNAERDEVNKVLGME